MPEGDAHISLSRLRDGAGAAPEGDLACAASPGRRAGARAGAPATTFHVNGKLVTAAAAPATPLLIVVRNDCALNGPKYGCGVGECGACMVLIDQRAARSCCVPLAAAAGREVTTLEGLGRRGALHAVQQAFVDEQAAQCGYCTNGMIVAAVALLARVPRPTDDEIRAALSHNLCRCGTHVEIVRAVQRAADLLHAA